MAIQVPEPPPPSSPAASAVMRGNRGRDTEPERTLRSELHARGLRFRANYRAEPALRCRPDIVFTRAKLAVFVDGCFWHRCPEHGVAPETNSRYWTAKIARNVERDAENNAALAAAGWVVIRIWEHDDFDDAAERVTRAYRAILPVGPPAHPVPALP